MKKLLIIARERAGALADVCARLHVSATTLKLCNTERKELRPAAPLRWGLLVWIGLVHILQTLEWIGS